MLRDAGVVLFALLAVAWLVVAVRTAYAELSSRTG
jgi:hypothetical protein